MNTPKISVLVPMYNRKHYIEDCVNSVLNQTFKDFEIIIRDDGSKDGSAEFVEEKYSDEISSGKIKLMRNEKNCGEGRTTFKLIRDSNGDYFQILHSDDAILPIALQQMYEVAKKTNADVVHSVGRLLTPSNGSLNPKTLVPNIHERSVPKQGQLQFVPENPMLRLMEWATGGIFGDIPYNLFSKKFIERDDLFNFDFGPRPLSTFHLFWVMKAKILVKAPIIYYIYRNSYDSLSRNEKVSLKYFVSYKLKQARYIEELFQRIESFKNNKEVLRFAKLMFLTKDYDFQINRFNIFKEGFNSKSWEEIESAFKEEFGNSDAFFPTLLFSWLECIKHGYNIHQLMFNSALESSNKVTAPPPIHGTVDS